MIRLVVAEECDASSKEASASWHFADIRTFASAAFQLHPGLTKEKIAH